MKQAIELIRVSTEAQAGADRASIPAQRAVNRRTALAYGLTIVRSIEISDVSGAAVLLAPEIQQLLTLMADPEIHAVVAREFSRLMRPENFADYALLQAFADTNTVLYLPEGPIDFASKTGRLLGTIRAAIAGMERVEILERIWSAKEEKRRAGGFGQSRVCLPFGVTFDGAWKYMPEAERVREAFRLVLSGETSYGAISRAVGIEPYNLRVMLRNPIYTGWRVIDKRRDPSPGAKLLRPNGRQGDRRKIKRADDDVIRVKVLEPLISEAQFNQVQSILEAKRRRHWRSRTDHAHRFTYNGFLTCTCGKVVHTKYRRRDYYVCRGRNLDHTCSEPYMRREVLEPYLDQLFATCLPSADFLEQIARASSAESPQLDAERLASQLEALAAKQQRVMDSYFEGLISKGERDSRLQTIERDRSRILELLQREPLAGTDAQTIAEIFAPFHEFDLLEREQKRRLLASLSTRIVAAGYRIDGVWIGHDSAKSKTAAVWILE